MLRRRGVKHHDIDEIVQETATRAISTRVPYDHADDLFRWASVVAGRLAIDLARRGARLSDDELPDRADTIDVAIAAEHRVVLGAVRSRLHELSSRDQEVLLSSFHDEPVSSRRESVRVAVARHRARNRLRVLLDGLAGAAILGWARRKRLWSAPVEAISYAVVPTAACLLMTVGALGGLSSAAMEDTGPQPVAITQVVSAPSASTTAAPTSSAEVKGEVGTSPPTPHRTTMEAVPDAHVSIPDPDGGHTTRVDVREKQESDHLWCLTPPPEAGQTARCVDSPVTVPSLP
jgi:hypothetical protein